MTILEVQQRYRELGRLRLGDTVAGDEGKRARPVRLSTWRLTSPSRELLQVAADHYGGQVGVWQGAPTEGEQFELTTDAEALDVLVPPQDLLGRQFLELYTRGGVKRRCDGETELLSGRPCMCDPAARDCSPVTHLLVLLPDVPDVGVWRVVTRSWYAAAELPGTVALLARLAEQGAIPRAQLKIEARTTIRDGQTRHYVLPVLSVTWSLAQAEREGVPILGQGRPAIASGDAPLPVDAGFAHDRADDWGDAPALPEARSASTANPPPPAAQPAVEVEGHTAAGKGMGPVEGRGGPEAGPVPPEGAIADTMPPEGQRFMTSSTAHPGPVPPEGAPWTRYNTALLAFGRPELAAPLLKRAIGGAGLRYPPLPDWPPEVLTSCAAILEGAVAAQQGA